VKNSVFGLLVIHLGNTFKAPKKLPVKHISLKRNSYEVIKTFKESRWFAKKWNNIHQMT
jgi:hypothetical protein